MHPREQTADTDPRPSSGRRYVLKGQALEAPALAPGLHIVATPIGNLRDFD